MTCYVVIVWYGVVWYGTVLRGVVCCVVWCGIVGVPDRPRISLASAMYNFVSDMTWYGIVGCDWV